MKTQFNVRIDTEVLIEFQKIVRKEKKGLGETIEGFMKYIIKQTRETEEWYAEDQMTNKEKK